MSAAARILKHGGTLILACECRDGIPAGSSFDQLLRSENSPEAILTRLSTPGFVRPEQWQAQIQALVQRKARILLFSSLSEDQVRNAHLTPCKDIGLEVQQILGRQSNSFRVGVLPQGPLTIPYLT